jgi:hypothetical protein
LLSCEQPFSPLPISRVAPSCELPCELLLNAVPPFVVVRSTALVLQAHAAMRLICLRVSRHSSPLSRACAMCFACEPHRAQPSLTHALPVCAFVSMHFPSSERAA